MSGVVETPRQADQAETVRRISVRCNNCSGARQIFLGQGPDFEYRTCGGEFRFVRCADCGLVYMPERPEVSELSRIYPESYIPYHFNEHLGRFIAFLRNAVQRHRIEPVERYAAPGSLIADVGCGAGEFLRILKRFGDPSWRLLGIDFARASIDHLQRFGIAGLEGRFETVPWTADRPTVIVMQQVIEHVEDPSAVVARAYDLLLPGGVLLVETPSMDGWDARWFQKRYWGGWHIPRHWTLYDERTLGDLLRKQRFTVEETSYLLSPNFWLQSIHHWLLERAPAWRRFERWFDVSCLPALALASLLDVFQIAVRGRSSNFRMVGRKRGGGDA